MAQTGIRDYLKSRGLQDNEITYDNGTVMAKGKRFMDATPQSDGSTYADTNMLNNAYNNYDMSNQLAQMQTRATQTDPELAAMRQALKDRISKPVQQFSYDQNNDPAYKSALESARQNSQTAAGNISADMNKRGLLNSTITQDRGNQAAAQEYNRVSNEIAPQLMQQAYQRYIGQQNLENQQTGNMMQYADSLDRTGQQQFRNQFDVLGQQNIMNQNDAINSRNQQQDSRQKRLDNTAIQQWYQQQYGVPIQAKDDWNLVADQVTGLKTVAQQKQESEAQKAAYDNAVKQFESLGTATPEIAQILGIPVGTTTQQARYQQGQLGVQQQNANTSTARANKPAAVKPPAQPKSTDYKIDPNFASDVAHIKSNPAAKSQLDSNPEPFIQAYGYDGYVALRKEAGLDKP